MKNAKFSAVRAVLMAVFALGVMLFLPSLFVGAFGIGGVVGIGFFAFLFACAFFWEKIKLLMKKRWGKALVAFISSFLSLCVIYGAILSGLMIGAACGAKAQSGADVVIVLGCNVKPDGKPSAALESRISAAYGYLSENPDAVCVASGAKGADEPFSEAFVIRRELVALGINEQRIFLEESSTSTEENLINSYRIIDEKRLGKRVVLVTNSFHIFRACELSKRQGKNAEVIAAPVPWTDFSVSWVREWLAITKALLLS